MQAGPGRRQHSLTPLLTALELSHRCSRLCVAPFVPCTVPLDAQSNLATTEPSESPLRVWLLLWTSNTSSMVAACRFPSAWFRYGRRRCRHPDEYNAALAERLFPKVGSASASRQRRNRVPLGRRRAPDNGYGAYPPPRQARFCIGQMGRVGRARLRVMSPRGWLSAPSEGDYRLLQRP